MDRHASDEPGLSGVGRAGLDSGSLNRLPGASDRGIVAIRRRFFQELETIAAGGETKGMLQDPDKNVRIELPMVYREQVVKSTPTPKSWHILRFVCLQFLCVSGRPAGLGSAVNIESHGFRIPGF